MDKRDLFGLCEMCDRTHHMRDMHLHHTQYRSAGNPDPMGDMWLCSACHTHLHSVAGDYKFWGAIGGTRTAEGVIERGETFRNLKPFREMTYDTPAELENAAEALEIVQDMQREMDGAK